MSKLKIIKDEVSNTISSYMLSTCVTLTLFIIWFISDFINGSVAYEPLVGVIISLHLLYQMWKSANQSSFQVPGMTLFKEDIAEGLNVINSSSKEVNISLEVISYRKKTIIKNFESIYDHESKDITMRTRFVISQNKIDDILNLRFIFDTKSSNIIIEAKSFNKRDNQRQTLATELVA